MGFESSDVARRRLAATAMSNQWVQDALILTGRDSPWSDGASEFGRSALAGSGGVLAGSLELLAQDIADTPGAGGALLAAFAEQVRALRLVAEAADRAPGTPLPASILAAVRSAIGEASFGSSAGRPTRSAAPPLP